MNTLLKKYGLFGVLLIWLLSIGVMQAGYTQIAVVLSAGYFVAYLGMVLFGKKNEYAVQFQWLIITTCYLVFWMAAFFCKTTIKDHIFTICFGLLCLLITWTILLGRTKDMFGTVLALVKENKGAVFVMLLFTVLAWETLFEYPRWDSLVYYSFPYNDTDLTDAALRFDFLFSDITKYNLIGHTSWGYTFIGMTGAMLTGVNPLGIHVINLILALTAIGCFYGIVKSVFQGAGQIEWTGMTLLFAVSPFVLGILGVINLDTPMLCFLIILTYCYRKQYKEITLIVSLLLAFAKEPGIIYYCLFVFGIWLEKWIKNKETNIIRRTFCTFRIEEYIKWLYIPVLWLTIFVLNSANAWGGDSGESAFRWDNNGFNCFGWSINNITEKSRQLLGLNFNWLLVAMIVIGIAGFLINVVKRKEINRTIQALEILPLLFAFIGVLAFNYLYITVYHARYLVAGVGTMTLLAVTGVYLAVDSKKIRNIIYYGVAVCLLIQNFYSLDPVTNTLFPSMEVGNVKVISLKGNGAFAFNDSIVYNRQYAYWDKLNQNIMKAIDYKEQDVIIYPEMYGGDTRISLTGTYDCYWEQNAQAFRTNYEEGRTVGVNIAVAPDADGLAQIEAEGRKFIIFPYFYWDGMSGIEEMLSKSTTIWSKEFSYRGWKAYVYELK